MLHFDLLTSSWVRDKTDKGLPKGSILLHLKYPLVGYKLDFKHLLHVILYIELGRDVSKGLYTPSLSSWNI